MEPDEDNTPDDSLDAVFGALADKSRRRILHMLQLSQEMRVGDIAEAFEMSLSAVSKHLKKLESAGLVLREKRGREHWIRPQPERLQAAAQFFNTYQQYWHDRLGALEDYLAPPTGENPQQEKNND